MAILLNTRFQPVWLARAAIDVHLAAGARLLRLGARLEQAGHVQPHVEADSGKKGGLGRVHSAPRVVARAEP